MINRKGNRVKVMFFCVRIVVTDEYFIVWLEVCVYCIRKVTVVFVKC